MGQSKGRGFVMVNTKEGGEYERELLGVLGPPPTGRSGGRAGRGAARRVGLPTRQRSAPLRSRARGHDRPPHRRPLVGGGGGAVRLVVGGANGLAWGCGLRARLLLSGAERGAWHPRFRDRQRGIAEPAPWWVYVRAAGGLPARVVRWLPVLPAGMVAEGVGSIRSGALGGWVSCRSQQGCLARLTLSPTLGASSGWALLT